jgi:hypothetical protein
MAKFILSAAASVGAVLLTAGAFVILLMMIVGLLVADGHPRSVDSLSNNFRLVPIWDHARSAT